MEAAETCEEIEEPHCVIVLPLRSCGVVANVGAPLTIPKSTC